MRKILAAGGVVWRGGENRHEPEKPGHGPIEFMIVHRPRYDDWSIPKGKLEPGELLPACAVREIAEETGVNVCLGPQLGTTTYPINGAQKEVTYWLARELQTSAVLARPYVEPASPQEINETRWVNLEEAQALLTQEFDRNLVTEAAKRLEQGWGKAAPLLLVRHGKAKNRMKWNTDDALRPLKKRGKRQAVALASNLSAFGVSRVFSSPWKRCDQTVSPYLKASGVPANYPDALSETGFAANPRETLELLRTLLTETPTEGPVAICSHAPVLVVLLRALGNDFLEKTLLPLETGESMVAHVVLDETQKPKIIAVERALAQPPEGYVVDGD